MIQHRLIQPGSNVSCVEKADRAALLVDGECYFAAFHAAIQQAQYTVYILSWDIDSRTQLIRGASDDNVPRELGALLATVLKQRPDLNIYILNWDWAMLYTLEREWLPTYKRWSKKQNRLHFELDGFCPLGASQHQKVVVIDDKLAFSGGFDLGKNRWDTSDHAAGDPRRVNPDKTSFPPFHDVQMMVEGRIAARLGKHARERWQKATGKILKAPPTVEKSAWPENIKADFNQVEIAVALTQPAFETQMEKREVERLYLDSITAAKNLIYIENQYFTSWRIADALTYSLQSAHGPDVVIVLPLMTGGWLEQLTMDVLRSRVVQKIREADKYHRLRVCYPHHEALGEGHISLHSKLMIVDDQLLRVGSANLSNRSMGLDSECDLIIEARNADEQQVIKQFLQRLVTEHLALEVAEFEALMEQHGRVPLVIDALANRTRCLKQLECAVSERTDELVPEAQIIDPEKPLDAEDMANFLLPIDQQKLFKKQWIIGLAVLLGVLLLTLAWRFTPLAEWLSQENLRQAGEAVKRHPLAPLFVLTTFTIGSLVAFPVTLLIIVTVLTFGPWLGSIYALVGSVVGALAGFAAGHLLGRGSIQKLAGSSLHDLSSRLAKQGVLAIVTVRIVPVAPFTVINLVAGASHIRLVDFFWGTLLGMLPGIIAITIFADSLIALLKQPEPEQIGFLAGILLLIGLATWLLKKFFKSRQPLP